jgi:hypothetical protein
MRNRKISTCYDLATLTDRELIREEKQASQEDRGVDLWIIANELHFRQMMKKHPNHPMKGN